MKRNSKSFIQVTMSIRATLNLSVLILFFISGHLIAQSEFETYKNGLIYSEGTMNKLERIVDSLSLKYKTCDLNKVFYSKSQVIGHIIRLDTGDIKKAKRDMDNQLSFEAFMSHYPNAEVEKNVLIVKFQYTDYDNKNIVEYSEVDLNSDYGLEIQRENTKGHYSKALKNTWLYEYAEKSTYSKESLRAFYFPENFKTMPLKEKYNRQIGYSDCLIDTTSTKFFKNTKDGDVMLPKNWQDLSLKSKQKLLKQMRSTRVIGFCSMDERPREHAVNIALLSAETANWEVFLKSHLDIMNDRFDRMSDGSYAYAQRQTYIKELEELNINVTDLLLGISLRVENPASNHYYGSIGRLGRAISESIHKREFENQMLSMIEDRDLDDYNRVLAYFLFLNYTHCLENKVDQKTSENKLVASLSKLPVYIREKIQLNRN